MSEVPLYPSSGEGVILDPPQVLTSSTGPRLLRMPYGRSVLASGYFRV